MSARLVSDKCAGLDFCLKEATLVLDAHAHHDRYTEEQWPDVLEAIETHRVFTLTNAVDIESYERAKRLAKESSLVVPGFGIHPWEAPLHDSDPSRYAHLLVQAVFIGEIGLDQQCVEEPEHYPAQVRVFEHQLAVAARLKKLVNVHTSGAESETFEYLTDHGPDRVIIHWYSGPIDVLKKMIDVGYMFTVGVEVLHSPHIKEPA